MALTRTPRGRWIDEGLRALAAGGPDAVRIEPLAQALGVTEGDFYRHFNDRCTLLDKCSTRWSLTIRPVHQKRDRAYSNSHND